MKEKGFTLIELLAVIVILAIIALIAVPIIIDIIEDSKKEAQKRSAENYTKAVKNAIVSSQLDGSKGITGSFTTDTLSDVVNVKYDGEKVSCDTIKIYEDGSLYITGCSVGGKSIEYTYGKSKQICTFANEGEEGKVGAKYTCKVNDKDTFTFYILSKINEEGQISDMFSQNNDEVPFAYNLIMDKNICIDGTEDLTGECKTQWVSESDYNSSPGTGEGYGADGNYDKGPITAMEYLYEATSSWNNLYLIDLVNNDSNFTGIGQSTYNGYGSITTLGTTTTITMKDGSITATFENMKSRLPRTYEGNFEGNYWFSDSYKASWGPKRAMGMQNFMADHANINSSLGIRPVITVKPSDLGL